jgi:hypothetical protein
MSDALESQRQSPESSGDHHPQKPLQLAPLAADLVRLLGWVLAGSFILSAGSIAACRLSASRSHNGSACAELLPSLERKQQDAFDTLLALLAGAGIGRAP